MCGKNNNGNVIAGSSGSVASIVHQVSWKSANWQYLVIGRHRRVALITLERETLYMALTGVNKYRKIFSYYSALRSEVRDSGMTLCTLSLFSNSGREKRYSSYPWRSGRIWGPRSLLNSGFRGLFPNRAEWNCSHMNLVHCTELRDHQLETEPAPLSVALKD